MKNVKLFTTVLLITTTILYVAIAFVKWDISWIDILPDLSISERYIFLVGILGNIGIDIWAYQYIKGRFFDKDLTADSISEKNEQAKLKNKFDNPKNYE